MATKTKQEPPAVQLEEARAFLEDAGKRLAALNAKVRQVEERGRNLMDAHARAGRPDGARIQEQLGALYVEAEPIKRQVEDLEAVIRQKEEDCRQVELAAVRDECMMLVPLVKNSQVELEKAVEHLLSALREYEIGSEELFNRARRIGSLRNGATVWGVVDTNVRDAIIYQIRGNTPNTRRGSASWEHPLSEVFAVRLRRHGFNPNGSI